MKCIRLDCPNELNSGKKYCSSRCAALDRKRVRTEKAAEAIALTMPAELSDKLITLIGQENQQLVLAEVNRFLAETDKKELAVSIPLPLTGQTYGDLVLSYDGTKEYRPSTTLSFDVIDKMLRSGPVVFAMEMKRAQVFRVFSQGRYKVVSPDSELAEVAEAALKLIMPKMMHDVTYSCFAYGTSFSEEIWEWKTKYQLGITEEAKVGEEKPTDDSKKLEVGGKNAKFLVPKVPNAVNPNTVDYIARTKDGSFDGFAQKQKFFGGSLVSIDPIIVDREQALVIPLNEHFRNLWGESTLKPMYVLWLWYEVVFRTMVKYMDRMAIPWKVATAPARQTVTVSGSNAPVRAMDLALALAGNLDKSGAVAIPSDADENGRPLWDLKLLTAESRVTLFLEVLQYLSQEMIRAALSADRSLSQSSGGVGSYNIGEVHAAASAVTSEMLLLQFLHYLNMYFMPEFSLYNRGVDGPPIWLRTQSIDTQERELLMQLIGVAGNSPAAMEMFYMVDWRTLLETGNIPSLTEELVKKLKDELNKEADGKMERQQEIMAKNAVPVAKGGASAFPEKNVKKPTTPEPTAVKTETDDFNIALENVFKHQIPWMLGEQECMALYEAGLVSEEVIRLFNPFHSKADGRFTSGPGGGRGIGAIGGGGNPAASATREIAKSEAINKASTTGSIVKTTGAILGIGGLGLVGLAVINRLTKGTSINPSEGDLQIGAQQDAEQRRKELEQKLSDLTKDWPKSGSPEEAMQRAISVLRQVGVTEIPSDLKLELTGGLPSGQAGQYRSDTNTLLLSNDVVEGLKAGEPAAIWFLAHEVAHSQQESSGQDQNFGNFSEFPEEAPLNNSNFRDFLEGQNDLVTSLGMSKMYGRPMSQDDAVGLTNQYTQLKSDLAFSSFRSEQNLGGNQTIVVQGISSDTDSDLISVGYPEQSRVWAGLAVEVARRSGVSPQDYLISQHKNGWSMNEQHQELVNLFPDEMKNGGYYAQVEEGGLFGFGATTRTERRYPSMAEVRTWMSNHGYADPDKAYQQMLEEAANG